MPGDQTNGLVGLGAYSHINRLFDRERMALATSKSFREKVSPVQRREEVDALLHAESIGIPRARGHGAMYLF